MCIKGAWLRSVCYLHIYIFEASSESNGHGFFLIP